MKHIFYYSLFLLCTFLFVSCEKEGTNLAETDLSTDSQEVTEKYMQNRIAILPVGFDINSGEEVETYFSELNKQQTYELEEHTRIGFFLEEIGLREQVEEDMQIGDLYTDVNLSLYLSKDQLESLESSDILQFRNDGYCGSWQNDGFQTFCGEFTIFGLCIGTYSCWKEVRGCAKWPYVQYRYGSCW